MTLAIEQMRRWCLRHTRRGAKKHLREYNREFQTGAFLRTLNWEPTKFYKWLHGKEPMPERIRRTMSRFIAEWEAGKLAFSRNSINGNRARLIRVENPRPRTQLSVAFGPGGASLSFLPRPAIEPVMPAFSDLLKKTS